jgi:hypothetical protein
MKAYDAKLALVEMRGSIPPEHQNVIKSLIKIAETEEERKKKAEETGNTTVTPPDSKVEEVTEDEYDNPYGWGTY